MRKATLAALGVFVIAATSTTIENALHAPEGTVARADDDRALAAGRAVFGAALEYAYEFSFSCLANQRECGLDGMEMGLLDSIYKEMLFTRPAPILDFKAGALDPAFFLIDGAVRLARTGNVRGNKVWINTDFFATVKDEMGVFPFSRAVANVIHELGHHNTVFLPEPVDHEALDVLGLKVATQLERYGNEQTFRPQGAPGGIPSQPVRVSVISSQGNAGQNQNRGLIFVTDASGVRFLASEPLAGVGCPRMFMRGELDFEGVPARFHLDEFAFGAVRENEQTFEVDLDVTKATVLCRNTLAGREGIVNFFDRYRGGKLTVGFARDPSGGNFVYSESRLSIPTPPDEHWN